MTHPRSHLHQGHHQGHHQDHHRGFTLIEMSMVLISIAMLAAAIMAGQSILRNSRLLEINADVEMYKNAVMAFKEKYKYLPGDFPTATNLWGSDTSCPETPANDVAKRKTCNGNGDSYIGDNNGSAYGDAANWHESYRFWQHLSNAGLISGIYNGTTSSRSPLGADPGMNIPSSGILGNGYSMLYVLPGPQTGVYSSNYRHVFIYGSPVGPKNSTYGPGITATEALMIDKKVDDGKPGSGFILSFTEETEKTSKCVTNKSEIGAQYNTEPNPETRTEDISCSLIFITGM